MKDSSQALELAVTSEKGLAIRNDQGAPLGWFYAVKTRDAVAQTRDGWPYFEANERGADATGATVFEIRFGDDEWMLVVEGDLLERDQ